MTRVRAERSRGWPSMVLFVAMWAPACADQPTGLRIEPVIYGADERLEVYEVSPGPVRTVATTAVPALLRATSLSIAGDRVTPLGPTAGDEHGLCPDERFVNQVSGVGCTAVLVDDDLVLTAGHCLNDRPCADQRYLFGWYYDAPGLLRDTLTSDVFSCWQIVLSANVGDRDFAFVRLDRPAAGAPVAVRPTRPSLGETLSLVGYPTGLPAKVVESGTVTSTTVGSSFRVRVDALPGNSGSPLLDAAGAFVGLLHSGRAPSFVDAGACSRVNVFPDDTVDAERAMYAIDAVSELCALGYPSVRLCGRDPTCGDGWCAPAEFAACALDCDSICGNGDCEPGETCAVDCVVDAGGEPSDAGVAPPRAADCRRCTAAPPASASPWWVGLLVLAAAFSLSRGVRRELGIRHQLSALGDRHGVQPEAARPRGSYGARAYASSKCGVPP